MCIRYFGTALSIPTRVFTFTQQLSAASGAFPAFPLVISLLSNSGRTTLMYFGFPTRAASSATEDYHHLGKFQVRDA